MQVDTDESGIHLAFVRCEAHAVDNGSEGSPGLSKAARLTAAACTNVVYGISLEKHRDR